MSVQLRAVVFDFDGLVLDTELPVYASWCAAFVAHGADPPTLEEWSVTIGTADEVDVHAWLTERADRPVDRAAMDASRRAHRDALLEVEVARPGVIEWLAEADAAGVHLAIASSSPADWVEEHLGRLDLRARFATVVTAGGALRGKPAPDVYLEACAAAARRSGPHARRGGLAQRDRRRESGRALVRQRAQRPDRAAGSLRRRCPPRVTCRVHACGRGPTSRRTRVELVAAGY